MKTKILMTSSCLIFGILGISALFMPDRVLSAFGINTTDASSLLVQLMGTLFFAFALMNWTVKDGVIGGIYQRPVSLANFAHFFAGALTALKYLLSHSASPLIVGIAVIYAAYAVMFYWLVFRSTGLKPD
jgi:hypothetical protein